MNTIDPTAEFPKAEKTIYELAWKFAKAHPYPNEEQMFEELRSIGYYAYMRCCDDFKPERGTKFNTWVYRWCWDLMKTHIMKASANPVTYVEINEEILGAAPSMRIESLEIIEDLSEDARTMVMLIIETPKDLLAAGPLSVRQLMKTVKEHMVKSGRSLAAVNKAHSELQTRFAEAWAS